MCLSSGSSPMPASLSNAVCGPQVIGTLAPTDGTSLADLNPCPLNACCDIWGQCGTTAEFCTITDSTTGAPGTAAAGTNGCISNCGTSIIIGAPSASFMKIAYFEGFNANRPCLNMDLTDLNTTSFTHVHLAFATITEDFNVNVSAIQDQFDMLLSLTGVKRILSFGGWSFSTDQDSYPIFRDSVTAANRNTFIANIIAFVKKWDLDGVDFDWEYPGAIDIPGIPAGSADEGINYLLFLWLLKLQLPAGVTVSMAAPASYWYLKGFPIEAMGSILDYVVFMTYDLHGQWDYGNQWSDPGCPGGNCLRSHVNLTETLNSLSMITKAGVPSGKIVVGVTSYGRAFEMTSAGCTTEMCEYTGPVSGATPGECTGTPGYIADCEIADIINGGGDISTYDDSNSYSQILVYNDTQWVAYMSDANKALRTYVYYIYGFGGTADWAVDLDLTTSADNEVLDCPNSYDSVDDVAADATISDDCMNIYLKQALGTMLNSALTQYGAIMNSDYDKKFTEYAKSAKEQAPVQLSDFWGDDIDNYVSCTYAVYSDGAYTNHSGLGCPPKNTPTEYDDYAYDIYMVPNDLDTFYSYMESKYGIDRSWVIFPVIQTSPCLPDEQDCSAFGNLYGSPSIDPDIVVSDPKDVISNSLANLTTLASLLLDIAHDAALELYGGDCADTADSSSMPVYMAQGAVTSMSQVVDTAGKLEEEERKDMMLLFLTGLLFLVPFVGEALSGIAELATLARFVTMLGTMGDGAMAVYGVVEDPTSAPLMIIGMLLGGMFTSDTKFFSDAATVRRGMSEGEVAALGDVVSTAMTKVSNTFKMCKI